MRNTTSWIGAFLVEKDSVDALAEAMNELLADPVRAEAMGRAGMERAQHEFGWKHCADRSAEIYAQALHG